MDPNLSDQNLQIKHLQNGVSMNSKFAFLIAIDLVPKQKKKNLFPSLFSWTFFALRLSLSSQP